MTATASRRLHGRLVSPIPGRRSSSLTYLGPFRTGLGSPGPAVVLTRGKGLFERNGAISASLSKVTPTSAMHISSFVLSPQLTGTSGLFGLFGLLSELSNVQVRLTLEPDFSATAEL